MVEKNVMLVLIDQRREAAVEVQKVLTSFGCQIKTRLGLHDADANSCSNHGLLFLELIGTKEERDSLARQLTGIKGVKSQLVTLALED